MSVTKCRGALELRDKRPALSTEELEPCLFPVMDNLPAHT